MFKFDNRSICFYINSKNKEMGIAEHKFVILYVCKMYFEQMENRILVLGILLL